MEDEKAAIEWMAEVARWLPTAAAFAGALLGGVLASLVQIRGADRNRRKATRSEKLGQIATLSVECQNYVFAEQKTNTYTTQMMAASRHLGIQKVDEGFGAWVPKPEPLPHRTLELENLVRQFLPQETSWVHSIRLLESEFQTKFSDIQSEVLAMEPANISPGEIGLRCVIETKPLVDKISIAHETLRKAASAAKLHYD